jgi:hypothetical protein
MTRIHVIGDDGDVEIWLDTEVDECDGICIGHAGSGIQALDDARAELKARLADVEELMRQAAVPLWSDGT